MNKKKRINSNTYKSMQIRIAQFEEAAKLALYALECNRDGELLLVLESEVIEKLKAILNK